MNKQIDINSDMGEIQQLLDNGTYADIMPYISSINVACGGHAGDDDMMTAMVVMAKERGVNIGAHPSFPDRENFGRVIMEMASSAIIETVADQVSHLQKIALNNGSFLTHVKPHGALYNLAVTNNDIAAAIGTGVKNVNERLKLVGLAGSTMLSVWRKMGFDTYGEGFADRTYESDGSLRNRKYDDALIIIPTIAANQAGKMACNEKFNAIDGSQIKMDIQSVCIHSDTPNSVEIAKAVYSVLRL
jgi:UPF0271 protein